MNPKITAALRGLFALCAIAFTVSTASAETGEKPEKKIPPGQLKKYDKDGDGSLSAEEKAAWEADKAKQKEKYEEQKKKDLEKYDTDKDGQLSTEEKAAMQADKKAAHEAKKKKKDEAATPPAQ